MPGRAGFYLRGVCTHAGADQSAPGTIQRLGAGDMKLASAAVSSRSNCKEDIPYLHCDEQVLEEYCLGLLSEGRTAVVEEHLLVCEECRQALSAQNEFIQCLKSVLRQQQTPHYLQRSA